MSDPKYFLFTPRLGKDGKQEVRRPKHGDYYLFKTEAFLVRYPSDYKGSFPILDLVILDEDPRSDLKIAEEVVVGQDHELESLFAELTRLREELEGLEKELNKYRGIIHE